MKQLDSIRSKILDDKTLPSTLDKWRKEKNVIVFTNGCFDLIHRGHIDYLAKAKEMGDKLIIGVNTDRSVSRIKGEHRPLQDENSRLFILAAMQFVDAVILFGEDTPYELIRQVQPDILVKGADYKAEDIVGYDIVRAKGGKVMTIEYLPGFSTTAIEQKIIEASTQMTLLPYCKPEH